MFHQDKNWRSLNAYLALKNLKREPDGSIEEYLRKFDSRVYKLKVNMELPDDILTCRLLKSCSLGDLHFQMVLSTTPEMTFDNMKQTLKKLFTKKSGLLNTSESECIQTLVNNEPSMDAEALSNRQNHKQRGNDRCYQGRGREGKNNPLGGDSKITQCFICGSSKHWGCSCPHAKAEEVQILWMA